MGRLAKAVIVLSLAPLLSFGAGSGVAVRQLDEILAAARAKGAADDAIAERIAHLNLKERLTRAALSHLSGSLGRRTAAALQLLADRSAFLDPPADEIVPGEPPSAAEQHAIVERAAAYTLTYVKELPNIVCSRIVSRFDDLDAGGRRQLRLRDTLTGELTVRDGTESFHIQNAGLITAHANGAGGFEQTPNDLMSSGEFGSILAELFVTRSAFVWHRWEKLDGQRLAVVGYSAPLEGSLFTVSWCCLASVRNSRPWSVKSAYQGEVSIDPASGAILRVTRQAVNLPRAFPVRQTWLVVEYLPVKLGERPLLLPARSLSFMGTLSAPIPDRAPDYVSRAPPAPPDHEHYLNRSEFRDYHKFAAQSNLAFDVQPEAPPVPIASLPVTAVTGEAASAPTATVTGAALPEAPALPERPAGEPNVTLPVNGIAPPVSPPQATPSPIKEEPPPADSQPVFRVRRNEIPVRVVARDERGDAVGGLRKEDFALFDNGKLQQISGFRIESREAENAPSETGVGIAAPQDRPAPLRDRYVVFLFDDVDLSFEDLASTRAAAKRAIRDVIGPGTPVALLTETGKQYVDFTGDLAKLEDALDRIRSQAISSDSVAASAFAWVNIPAGPPGAMFKKDGVGATPAQTPPGTAGFSPDSVAFGHTGDYSRFRSILKGVEAAVDRLAVMPGDRSVILLSPGFAVSDADQREYFELIDRAARKGIPINTLDARGVWTLPEFAAERTMIADPDHQSAKSPHEGELRAGLFLRGLADGTGGIAVADNDFYGGLKRMAMPPEFTYTLTFSPPDLVPDGKYHRLKVEVPNRRGIALQARNGYLAPDKTPTEAEQAAREIEDAIFSRDEMREIPLAVRVDRPEASAKLSTTMHIGLSAIRFDMNDGHSRASLIATVGLFDANGIYVDGKQEKLDLDYSDGKVPAGLDVKSEFPAPPGTYLVRVVVRDADGHMSSINQTAEVR